MLVYFKTSFFKDLKKLPSDTKREVRFICFTIFPKLHNGGHDLKRYDIKPIKGFKGYFRIRLGDYRVGFKMKDKSVEFMRVKHRKDIYKHFP